MIYINKEYKNELKDCCFVFDFDRTITSSNSVTSWKAIEINEKIGKDYIANSDNLYRIYRKIEIDYNLDFNYRRKKMLEWVKNQILALNKYNISEETFNAIINQKEVIDFKKGIYQLFSFANKNNIPVIIASAGVGNVIKNSLYQKGYLLDNIYIFSNNIVYENSLFKIDGPIITSMEKENILLPDHLKCFKNLLVFGDQIEDINVSKNFCYENLYSIGFLTDDTGSKKDIYMQYFDAVCTDDEDYHNILNMLFNMEEVYENKSNQKTKKWKI